MKTKITLFLKYTAILLCSTLLLLACSKDDVPGNEPEPVNKLQLLLKASANDISEGDEVTFTITADEKVVDADIYIDDEKLIGTSYTFSKSGEYTAVAKKKDYKDSNTLKITVKTPLKKIAKIVFNKINTTPYSPAYGIGPSKITMSKTHVYTFSNTTEKFKRYSLADSTWEELNHTNELNFQSGIEGRMLYIEDGVLGYGTLFYLIHKMSVYFPKEFKGPIQLRNTWKQFDVPNQYSNGERAAAVHGKYLYYVGSNKPGADAKSIDRYHPDTNTWETPAQLPLAVNRGAQATIYNDKMYIMGVVSPNPANAYSVFYVYDTQQLTVQNIALPEVLRQNFRISELNQQLVSFKNYVLFYHDNNIFVFDTVVNQWLETPIKASNMFDDIRYCDFVSPSVDKLYAAGTKNGNFILYELDFSVTEEW